MTTERDSLQIKLEAELGRATGADAEAIRQHYREQIDKLKEEKDALKRRADKAVED